MQLADVATLQILYAVVGKLLAGDTSTITSLTPDSSSSGVMSFRRSERHCRRWRELPDIERALLAIEGRLFVEPGAKPI